MKIGNTSFNMEAINGMTKEEFLEKYEGRIFDIKAVADTLNRYFKKVEKKKKKKQED